MGNELFREGGPHNIRRTGRDKYQMSVSIPKGQDGMTARECTDTSWSARLDFRVRGGTGIIEGHIAAFALYRRCSGKPSEFHTEGPVEVRGTDRGKRGHRWRRGDARDNLGLGSSGSRRIGGGAIID